MGLSPSTLFHFTSKDGLKGILSDNFKIFYCKEKLEHSIKPVEVAIPMVSFCDIKLSQITEHIEKYGHYGIGLTKEWAYENNINPVFYYNPNSEFVNNLFTTIRKLRLDKINSSDYFNLSRVIQYTKVYEGSLKTEKLNYSKYRFADEREWRYVNPEFHKNSEFIGWIQKDNFNTKEKKDLANSKVSLERLKFEPKDILYIIVDKEEEIEEFINHITHSKGKTFSHFEIERLKTRIVSCERIMNDF